MSNENSVFERDRATEQRFNPGGKDADIYHRALEKLATDQSQYQAVTAVWSAMLDYDEMTGATTHLRHFLTLIEISDLQELEERRREWEKLITGIRKIRAATI